MATSTITGNVLYLSIDSAKGKLAIDMSLQRHKYDYCGGGTAAAVNSLLYASVTDAVVLAEAVEVGTQVEAVLGTNAGYGALFGKRFTTKSGRVYLVDNSALDPKGWPNHFFVTSGSSVWAQMTQDEFVAAAALRRVQEQIAARVAGGDKTDYTDPKALNALRTSPGGAGNPVVAAYAAAHVAMNQVPAADPMLGAVSDRTAMVSAARQFY